MTAAAPAAPGYDCVMPNYVYLAPMPMQGAMAGTRTNSNYVARPPPPGPVMDSRRADSMVDVVWIEPRSIPSSAMVCAIAGEMHEMMVLHPINTAALAILIR